MLRQVGEAARCAETLQVVRAGAVDLLHQPQRAGDQCGVRQAADTHHAVEALAYQVDLVIGAAQFQLQVRVCGEKGRQVRQDQVAGQGLTHVDAQAAAQLAGVALEHCGDLVGVGQQVLAALVAGLAVLGQLHTAGGAVQQAHTEVILQALYQAGDAGLGLAEAFGGAGEAGQFGDADEGEHGVEAIHGDSLLLIHGQSKQEWLIYLAIVDQ